MRQRFRQDSRLVCNGIPVQSPQRYYDGPMTLSVEWEAFLAKHSTTAKRNKHMEQARRMKGNKLHLVVSGNE